MAAMSSMTDIAIDDDVDNDSRRGGGGGRMTMDEQCRRRWQWISKPGIYDENRFAVKECVQCRSSRGTSIKIALVLLLVVLLSAIASYFGFYLYRSEWYIDVSIGFLVCVFLTTTFVAPTSALWQTAQWVTMKMFEKSVWSLFAMAQTSALWQTAQWVTMKMFEKAVWSLFAMAQAPMFARWSRTMSTNDATLDAWLYMAIVPIIMNAFMFFMFSRISRLKLPCFAPKYGRKLEQRRQKHEANLLLLQGSANLDNNNNECDVSNTPLTQSGRGLSECAITFDKREAVRIGIFFMFMINTVLLVIAASFLAYQGSLNSIWILFISMIVVPLICAVIAIYTFAYFIDRGIHICPCCLDRKRLQKQLALHASPINNGLYGLG
eukprot:CAMPEP_0202727414 /NCGR_PEP_ID=MMETSP1385-20130828/185109_1 /ASSEMBLY_ACC=CAM_ASM_000861 /TAXON_ID=933848 /ORGANISM="Elphidium margaritaceum" /LENGTH=378 /DNA_ID=CAMNT_0049393653 /DNA_START=292 /DNA_END=1428 /DNA_ORIENTATION=-